MLPLLRIINIAIGIVTVISGAVQTVRPAYILRLVHAEVSAATTQSFATLGFFMVLFGGLLVQSLARRPLFAALAPGFALPRAVFWCGLQKVGASAAVFIGIHHGVFGGLAAAVASFDALSALLILSYYRAARRARFIP